MPPDYAFSFRRNVTAVNFYDGNQINSKLLCTIKDKYLFSRDRIFKTLHHYRCTTKSCPSRVIYNHNLKKCFNANMKPHNHNNHNVEIEICKVRNKIIKKYRSFPSEGTKKDTLYKSIQRDVIE